MEALPDPKPGEPTRYRVAEAQIDPDTAFVPMLKYDGAVGNEADLWDRSTGVTNVMRALSLVPNAVREWKIVGDAQYLSLSDVHDLTAGADTRALDRLQIELVATRVSSFNECFY